MIHPGPWQSRGGSRADSLRDTSRVTARLSPHCRKSHVAGSAARRVTTVCARFAGCRTHSRQRHHSRDQGETSLSPNRPPFSVASPAVAHAAPSTTAPASATSAAAPQRSVSFAAAAVDLSAARRSLRTRSNERTLSATTTDLSGPSGATAGSNMRARGSPARRARRRHRPSGTFSGASVFVVSRHGALLGRAGNIWHDFGGRRKIGETPHATAFREMREEIGLTAAHVDLVQSQPIWVVHAGYRHAVFVATITEASRARSDWGLSTAATPELDEYRNNFVDFANFFATTCTAYEMVHRRFKTREVFDLASDAYLGLCRAAHRAGRGVRRARRQRRRRRTTPARHRLLRRHDNDRGRTSASSGAARQATSPALATARQRRRRRRATSDTAGARSGACHAPRATAATTPAARRHSRQRTTHLALRNRRSAASATSSCGGPIASAPADTPPTSSPRRPRQRRSPPPTATCGRRPSAPACRQSTACFTKSAPATARCRTAWLTTASPPER